MMERRLTRTTCAFGALMVASSPATGQAPARLVPAVEIGCASCDGPTLFSSVMSVAWLPDGDVLLIDADEPFVRIFGADGSVRMAFGREGSGPGELRGPVAAALVATDTIEVMDLRLYRLARFTRSGTAAGTRSFPRLAFPLASLRDEVRASWLLATTDFRRPTATFRRLADGTAEADSLFTLPAAFPRDRDGQPTPYAAYGVAPDGSVYVGEGAFAYRIRRLGVDGTSLGEIVRELSRPRRTAVEMERERERRDRSMARLQAMRAAEGGGPGTPPPVPEERNHFDVGAFAFDPDGRLWVRTNRGGEDRTVFDVFSGTTFLGEVSVDAPIGAWALGRSGLVAAVHGEDFVPRIRIWRWG